MDFQTPPDVCDYMVGFIPKFQKFTILEPTKGEGNLVAAIQKHVPDSIITTPENFWDLPKSKYDFVVMNPPFTPMDIEIIFKDYQNKKINM
jgi:type I restriction-modification system DNA methylase subunit